MKKVVITKDTGKNLSRIVGTKTKDGWKLWQETHYATKLGGGWEITLAPGPFWFLTKKEAIKLARIFLEPPSNKPNPQ